MPAPVSVTVMRIRPASRCSKPTETDRSAGVLDRVREEVEKNLIEPLTVGENHHFVDRRVDLDRDAARCASGRTSSIAC